MTINVIAFFIVVLAGKLGTVAPKIESNVSPVVTVKTENKTLPPVVTPIATGETDVLLVGMEYIEEIKDETGVFIISIYM